MACCICCCICCCISCIRCCIWSPPPSPPPGFLPPALGSIPSRVCSCSSTSAARALQAELAHQPLLAVAGLLFRQQGPHAAQVDHGVQGLQAIGGRQWRELAVGAQHGLELFGGLLGHDPTQGGNDTRTNSCGSRRSTPPGLTRGTGTAGSPASSGSPPKAPHPAAVA